MDLVQKPWSESWLAWHTTVLPFQSCISLSWASTEGFDPDVVMSIRTWFCGRCLILSSEKVASIKQLWLSEDGSSVYLQELCTFSSVHVFCSQAFTQSNFRSQHPFENPKHTRHSTLSFIIKNNDMRYCTVKLSTFFVLRTFSSLLSVFWGSEASSLPVSIHTFAAQHWLSMSC